MKTRTAVIQHSKGVIILTLGIKRVGVMVVMCTRAPTSAHTHRMGSQLKNRCSENIQAIEEDESEESRGSKGKEKCRREVGEEERNRGQRAGNDAVVRVGRNKTETRSG